MRAIAILPLLLAACGGGDPGEGQARQRQNNASDSPGLAADQRQDNDNTQQYRDSPRPGSITLYDDQTGQATTVYYY